MTKSVSHGIWRPSASPTVHVPLGARSAGHASLQRGWLHGTGTLTWTNVYWGESGCGGPLVNGVQTEIPEGCLWLHAPGDHLSGYPIRSDWAYRWLTVDGPLARAMLEALGLVGPWSRRVGACPVDLFDQLEREIGEVGPSAEYRAAATAFSILTLAARRLSISPSGGPCRDRIESARMEIESRYTDPQLTVEALARAQGLHRSRFSRVFRNETGMSPKEYMQRLRLRKALMLLQDPDLTVSEIAHACGFADPAYFSRLIRTTTGLSPKRLREMA